MVSIGYSQEKNKISENQHIRTYWGGVQKWNWNSAFLMSPEESNGSVMFFCLNNHSRESVEKMCDK